MKKLLISMVAAGLISTSFAGSNSDGYFGVVGAKPASKAVLYPATDITISNMTSVTIMTTQPQYFTIDPNTNFHLRNSNSSADVYMVIVDQYQNRIFGREVCPHAMIDIKGQPGSYTVIYDEEYCH